MTISHLSTNSPASEISAASFDEQGYSEQSAQQSLDEIMANSPVAKLLGLDKSLPKEEKVVPAQDEASDEVPEEDDAGSENDDDEGDQETATEDDAEKEDDESTPEATLLEEDDIDWTYKIPVKIDGEVKYVTLEEARKGYATDQHLTSKGQQLGEQKKLLDKERNEKLHDLVKMGTVLHTELIAVEQGFETEYHKLTAEIDKAVSEDDSYAAREAREKRELVQEKYWKARNTREAKTKDVTERLQQQQVEQQQAALKVFHETIGTIIPDYSEKVAKSVREFALKEGIPEALLESIYDPAVVKFVNDYRKLKTAKDKGVAVRKAAPTVKSIPTKNGVPAAQKARQSDVATRSKVLSGQGSKSDEMAFLKRISTISKKL